METNALNGETNHQTSDHEVHVTHAEVNQESQEPTALKRNVVAESGGQENQKALEEPKLTNGTEENDKTESESSQPANEADDDDRKSAPEEEVESVPIVSHTSETFMKIEEKKVIERLSKVIDSELTLQLAEIKDKESNEAKDDEDQVKDATIAEDINESIEETEEVKQNVEEVEAKPHESNNFSATEEVVVQSNENTETEDSIGHEVDLKTGDSTNEPQETNVDNHVRLQAAEENAANHIENNQNSYANEEHEIREEAVVPEVVGVVKQNGNRFDENQNNEEEEEEEDNFQENIVFKSTLKKWSAGKSDESGVPQVNSRDKFKTLRQIKKGNTRSLMEKFQIPK